MSRLSALALVAVCVWACPAVGAEEIGPAGEPVVARVEREGDRYEVTVTPPPDRGVDRRVMEWLTDTASADDATDAEPADASGYHLRVEKTTSASCTSGYAIKSKPTNVAAHASLYVESETATFISATAFPTKGDVDIRIFAGTNSNQICASSARKKQNLDYASCSLPTCQYVAGTLHIKVEIYNPTAAQATVVTVAEFKFVTLP
jgi:hypothetical protein